MKSTINRNGSVSTSNKTGYLARRIAHHIASKLGDSSLEAYFLFYRCDTCEHIDFVVKNIYTRQCCVFTFTITEKITEDITRPSAPDITEAIHIIQLICGEFNIEPKLKKYESENAEYWKNTTLNTRLNYRKATNLHYLSSRDGFLDGIDLKRPVTITGYVGAGFNYFANGGGDHCITIPSEQAKDFTLKLLDAPIGLDIIIDAQSTTKSGNDYLLSSLIGQDNENGRKAVDLLAEAIADEKYDYVRDILQAWNEKDAVTGLAFDWYAPKED